MNKDYPIYDALIIYEVYKEKSKKEKYGTKKWEEVQWRGELDTVYKKMSEDELNCPIVLTQIRVRKKIADSFSLRILEIRKRKIMGYANNNS